MKTVLMTRGLDGWVRLHMGKGCILKMPGWQFDAALTAGKAERRSQLQAARETHAQAVHEAGRLAWIDIDASDHP